MWKNSNFTLPTVLIVENDSGDVFIVENQNKKSKNTIEKILTDKSPSTSKVTRRKAENKRKPRSPSPVSVK